jgi:L-lactate permease
MTADRALIWLLRFNAAVLLCAAPCALLPFSTMDMIHRELLGAPLPDLPISRYTTRSLSLLYASYGLITLFVTLDWRRYRPAVPFIAWLHIAFASAMVVVDWEAGMPWWWIAGEGPPLIGMGFVMLWLYRRASRADPDNSSASRPSSS